MRKFIIAMLLFGLVSLLISCANGGGSGRVYHHHHGYGPWWGSRDYYRDRVIVVPPDVDHAVEATPLPSGPEEMPDMGMPDMGDMGDDF
jgi:hypothetical protein